MRRRTLMYLAGAAVALLLIVKVVASVLSGGSGPGLIQSADEYVMPPKYEPDKLLLRQVCRSIALLTCTPSTV